MRRLYFAIFFLSACGGCTSLDAMPTPNLETPAAYLGRRLDDPALVQFIEREYPGRPANAWDADSLTLAALYYSPVLAQARSRLEIARAAEITAGQRPNPQISFTATRDESRIHPWLFGPAINLPIETAGKRERRIEQARHLASAAEYRIGAAAWQLRHRVISALIDVYAARASAALYRKQAAALKAVLDVFDQRATQGQLPSVTASQTLIAYQQAVLNEEEADRRLAEGRIDLAGAIGVSADALQDVAIDTGALEHPAPLAASLAAALQQNNDLLAALAEYAAAHSALRLELAKQFPDISLGPGYAWGKDGNVLTLGLSVDLPVFNNNEGPIAEAAARRKLAADAFNATQAEIIGRAESAQAGLNAARKKLQTADRLLAAQQDKLKRLQAQLRPGEASRLPLLLAESEIYAAAIARSETRVLVLNARAALEDALQQPQFGSAFGAKLIRAPALPAVP